MPALSLTLSRGEREHAVAHSNRGYFSEVSPKVASASLARWPRNDKRRQHLKTAAGMVTHNSSLSDQSGAVWVQRLAARR